MQEQTLPPETEIRYDFFGSKPHKSHYMIEEQYRSKYKLIGYNFSIHNPYIKLLDYKPVK